MADLFGMPNEVEVDSITTDAGRFTLLHDRTGGDKRWTVRAPTGARWSFRTEAGARSSPTWRRAVQPELPLREGLFR